MQSISRTEFLEQAPEPIKTLKIVVFALLAGLAGFFGVIHLFIKSNPQSPGAPDIFFITQFVLLAITMILSSYLEKAQFKGELDANEIFPILQNSVILKLAPLEGAAMFGLVVMFLNKSSGNIDGTYWYSLVPAAVFIFYAFPLVIKSPEDYIDYINNRTDNPIIYEIIPMTDLNSGVISVSLTSIFFLLSTDTSPVSISKCPASRSISSGICFRLKLGLKK